MNTSSVFELVKLGTFVVLREWNACYEMSSLGFDQHDTSFPIHVMSTTFYEALNTKEAFTSNVYGPVQHWQGQHGQA